MAQIKVGIFYPADPVGLIPGGIDTCIRGIIRWAPSDIDISVIGATTDAINRPVGKWTQCDLGRRKFDFFPVYHIKSPGKRTMIPETVKYIFYLFVSSVNRKFDVIGSHRIEPFVLFLSNKAPKVLFIHQNMSVIRSKGSDIRWSYFPKFYFFIESFFLKRIERINIVREDAVKYYQGRYPQSAEKFNFVPTWVDDEIFFPLEDSAKLKQKGVYLKKMGLSSDAELLIFVGRLDTQKDPLLLIQVLNELVSRNRNVHLLVVGDGVLREEVENKINQLTLQEHISLLGLKSPVEVAELLRIADLFVLTSVYEGMPRCVLEALGSGMPVVSTDVGEVRRVVKTGVNGVICNERAAIELADAAQEVLADIDHYKGKPCLDMAKQFLPEQVLAPVYDSYRKLAGVIS